MFDFDTLKTTLCITKTKLQREIKKIDPERIKYKNLHLYSEETLIKLLEKIMIEKIKKYND
jgi:hypothetical protein